MFDGMDDDLESVQFDFDDEDDDLLLAGVADEASTTCGEGDVGAGKSKSHNTSDDENLANISFGIESAAATSIHDHDVPGFDRSTGELWIYPTNYPIRDYQYNIVQQALHRNTLVVLPTGLGKTFIAAVVMYNMYRWFPQGKVVFMAPTKPLVAQQIHACYTIVGIPKADTIEMTGNMNPLERERMWRQKRVIFLTPQVMTNDLSRGSFSATSIKCLVVDEAHKAVGNHSYCQVIQGLLNFSNQFRVLALSATPGSDLKGVQQVMCNLLISHIELRSEESIDIRPYTHERKIDKIVVPMGEELSGVRVKYIQIMEMVVRRLIKHRVLFNREATKLSKFLILKSRDEYRQNPPSHIQGQLCGTIEADFATAISLYHGFELLQLHGLRSLYNFLLGLQSGDKGYGRTRYELCRSPCFMEIMEQLQEKFALKKLDGQGQDKDTKMAIGHPKMKRLEEIVVEHFKSFQEKSMDTRVMIFSQYRDSVEEIRNILNQHQPLVKVMAFIGQSSVGKSTKGYTQKEQLKVMRHFREGGYNTLVSTCVGEEGLDIGDVDLIVCFDAHKSPIRLVQRMGRTGRKRTGRIVMLVTKGKEEQIYNQSLYSKKSIHKAIANGAKSLNFYPHNPRLIPLDIIPKCHKMHITVKQPEMEDKKSKTNSGKTSKRKAGSKGIFDNGNDISVAFSKARSKQTSSELSNAEYEEIRKEFCQISKAAKHLPRPQCAILSKSVELEDGSDGRTMMNLSEWTPWQNRLQQAHLIGHSSTTRNLVQTCEFIELQQSIGEDANSYGLEMRLYLNKGDIGKTNLSVNQSIFNVSGQSSIKTFFTPSQGTKQISQSPKANLDEVSGGISKKSPGLSKGGIKKRKKKVRKDKANAATSGASTSNSSGLFTTIKSVMERIDDSDIEVIDGEMKTDVSLDSRFVPGVCGALLPTQRKKSNKKKLLNSKDAVWKDETSGKLTKQKIGKKKKSVLNIFNSSYARLNSDQNRGLEMDFDIDRLHHDEGEKERSFNKPFANITNGKSSSFNNKSAKKMIIHEDNCFMDDVIEIKDTDQQRLNEMHEQNSNLNKNNCRIPCMVPSPPRIEELPEIFGSLSSPINFACLDVYQLLHDREMTHLDFLNSSSNHPKLMHMSNKEMKSVPGKRNSSFTLTKTNESIDLEMEKAKEAKSVLPKLSKSTLPNEGQTKDDVILSNEAKINSSMLCRSDINVAGSQSNHKNTHPIEIDGASGDFCRSIRKKSLSPNSKANEMGIFDQADYSPMSSAFATESQPCKGNSLKQKVSDVDHQQKAESCRTSHPAFMDSINDVIGALDFDDHPFSPPPLLKKKADQGRLRDTSLRNVSTTNISLATFSQALDCLHSSSSDNLLSPTNSTPPKKSLDNPNSENFTDLKSLRTSIFPNETEHLHSGHFASSSVFQRCKSVKTSEEVKLNEETEEGFESTPQKLQRSWGFDEFASDSELCTTDIIPATPTKDCGRSTIRIGTSRQNNQSSFVCFNTIRSMRGTNCQDDPNTKDVSKNITKKSIDKPQSSVSIELNKFESEEFTVLQREEVQPYLLSDLSINYSNNKEHSVDLKYDNLVDGAIEEIEEKYDCLIVTPPSKIKPLPSTLHQNTECIEIFDSQPQHSVEHSTSPLHSKELPQINEKSRILAPCTTPTTSHSGAKSFLSTAKKKKLSLKSAGHNSFEYQSHRTPVKNDRKSIKKASSVKTLGGLINASTPVAKEIPDCGRGQAMDENRENDDDDIGTLLEMDHLTPIKGLTSTPLDEEEDVEKSFTIKRKRKPAAIIQSSSDSDSSAGQKSLWLCTKKKSNQNQSKDSKDKSKSLEEWQASYLDGILDEDDFEEFEQDFSKGKKSLTHQRKAKEKAKSVKRIKRNAGFVEHEADVSGGSASSDEGGEDEDDCYEGSFIDNDTSMAQTQEDGTDMRAVYLKSVKSPVHGKYKLQFNHAHNTDIFSQALTESQGMSEYEEDSFCVESDGEEESPVKESKKKKYKDKKKKHKTGKNSNKRRRVVCNVASSSSEDDGIGFPFTQEVTTNKRAIVKNALMSSSEDEKMDQEEESDGALNLLGRKPANILEDTNISNIRHLNRSLKEKSSFQGPGKSKNQTPRRNYQSALTSNNGVNKEEDHLDLDEWMDDFDAVDISCDYKNTILESRKEQLQAPFCHERSLCPKPMFNASRVGNNGGALSSHNIRGTSSLDHSKQSIQPDIYADTNVKARSAIPFVKPLIKNQVSSENENNKDSSFNFKDNSKSTALSRDITREERLKRQKEKQERFRQKLAQIQQQQQQPNSKAKCVIKMDDEFLDTRPCEQPFLAAPSTHTPSTSSTTHQIPSRKSIVHPYPSPLESSAVSSNISINTSATADTEALQILVDSREISGAQDVISSLRLRHNVTVTAKQLASCDYVLSNHLVVDRTCWSAFSNGANRSKLTFRLSEMQTLYRKCAIIIEAHKVKAGQEKNRKYSLSHSKYVDKTIACLIHTGIKVYFTDSAEQTASLLSELCQAEKRKGRHLTVPTKVNPKKEGMFSFIMSIPQINVMEALNLVHKYNNLADIVASPATVLQKKGCLSSEKVHWLYNYLRHKFDPQMLPTSYR